MAGGPKTRNTWFDFDYRLDCITSLSYFSLEPNLILTDIGAFSRRIMVIAMTFPTSYHIYKEIIPGI